MKIKVQFFPNQSFTVSLSASVYQCGKCDLSPVPAPHLTSTWQGPSPPRTLHTPDPGDKSSSRVWRRRTQEKVTQSPHSLRMHSFCPLERGAGILECCCCCHSRLPNNFAA